MACQVAVGYESVRPWVLQADIEDGTREDLTSAEHAETKRLKAEDSRLRKDVATLRVATPLFEGGLDPRGRYCWVSWTR